ncbi:MAG: hypothetical protein JXR05_05230 [Flavobacteriaceae bacterium]
METKLKTTIYLALLVLFNVQVYSQENDKMKKNEISIDIGNLINAYPEVSYYHLLSDESSIGVSAKFSIDNKNEYQFLFIPNYRIFFGKKKAAGFFIEGNVAFFSQYEQKSTFFFGTINATNNKKIGVGVGFAIGSKFLSKSGFTGEIFTGTGRNFINTNKIDRYYPRIGISIGKRF